MRDVFIGALIVVAHLAVPRPVRALQVGWPVASDSVTGATPLLSASEMRIEVSLHRRTLRVIVSGDTLLAAPVAVASGRVLAYNGRRWRFAMPRGTHVVRAKRANPVWSPPDWHYAETARDHHLRLRVLPATGVLLSDGSRLVVRDSVVGVVWPQHGGFEALPVDEHIVFDPTLFIPPLGTRNRQLVGALGFYALDLGNGYLLHGTPDLHSIGTATTHGCIRLGDDDIAWLYEHVPVGARVYVR